MGRHAVEVEELEGAEPQRVAHVGRRHCSERRLGVGAEDGVEDVAPLERAADELVGEAAVARSGTQLRQRAPRVVEVERRCARLRSAASAARAGPTSRGPALSGRGSLTSRPARAAQELAGRHPPPARLLQLEHLQPAVAGRR